MRIRINESLDDFRQIREGGFYYVDKSMVLKTYLEDHFKSAVLFARPRRFGKTLTMTMFRDFLDIRQNSKALFSGLEIMQHPDVVEKYMNQYPVIFMSLKEVFGECFEDAFAAMKIAVSKVCESHRDLLQSKKSSQVGKKFFNRLWNQEADKISTEQSLDLLCQMLHQHYGKPAFVIIDEYDVPMAKALGKPHYDQVREMIERMLSYVCKTNQNVKAVLLSGCLYTVKNSTYTGVNNITPYSVLSPIYASAIGFTDGDVKKLLSDTGLMDRYESAAEWYDGYLFGREKMYCPWDLLKYVESILEGSYSALWGPESYWVNTSEISQNLIHGFLGKTADVNQRFERLLAGETIECAVDENLAYHQIHTAGENLWSALVETGYLTKTVKDRMPVIPLRIPNKSIQIVFRREVWYYFKERVDNAFVRDLISALWAGETIQAQEALNQILEATLSYYHEYHEYSYHLILSGFFSGLGYLVQSEQETGYGRSDLIIQDPARLRAMILELKHVNKEAEMKNALQEASSQIIQNKYESNLQYEGYTTRLKYGMAFSGKRSLILLAEK